MPRVSVIAQGGTRRCPACRRPTLALSLLGVVATVGTARAQERAGHDPLSLPAGSLRVGLALGAGLDERFAGQPVSLAPDLHLGLTRRLTVGVVHSGPALDRLDSSWGLCVTGNDRGCRGVVSGTGWDARYTLVSLPVFELAPRVRFYTARYFQPLKLRTTVGLSGLLRLGPVALRVDPHLSWGLTHRDRGNGDELNLPVRLGVALGRYVAITLRTGVYGLLRCFSEQYAIPLGLGVLGHPTARWRVGAQFVLPRLLGPLNNPKQRDLLLYASYRFAALFGHRAVAPPATPRRDDRPAASTPQ